MNYGPLEFADYLRRNARSVDSATVRAARAAQPAAAPVNLLRVVSGPTSLQPARRATTAEPANVFEAVATNPPARRHTPETVRVSVSASDHPVILVLSSHQTTQWQLSVAPGADLRALLLSGFGHSMVVGAAGIAAHRIGGFYAFRRGSAEYRHLESEIRRCTGHAIGHFQSLQVGSSLQL